MTTSPNFGKIKEVFSEPGLERFLKKLRKKWTSRGSSGYIRLEKLDLEESKALSNLLGSFYRPGSTTPSISLRKLEEMLECSDLHCSLRQLFEVLAGRPILLRSEQLEEREAEWRALVQQAIERSGLIAEAERYPSIAEWAARLQAGGNAAGVRTLRKLTDTDRKFAEAGLQVCLATLMLLADRLRSEASELIRLPVLAAIQTGDAHAFDFSEPLGKLLWYGMTAFGEEGATASKEVEEVDELEPAAGALESAESLLRREVYRRTGVADDDISSQVTVYAPSWFGDAEERVLTLRQVDRMQQFPRCSAVYAVENPSVFATLVERTAVYLENLKVNVGRDQAVELPMLICVNGHPSAAVLRWLDRCMAVNGCDVQPPSFKYAGDFDVKGLEIAVGLRRRYLRSYTSWRMSANDYALATRGLALTDDEKERLSRMAGEGDTELIDAMLERGMKVYQELLLDRLHQDWIQAVDTGIQFQMDTSQ